MVLWTSTAYLHSLDHGPFASFGVLNKAKAHSYFGIHVLFPLRRKANDPSSSSPGLLVSGHIYNASSLFTIHKQICFYILFIISPSNEKFISATVLYLVYLDVRMSTYYSGNAHDSDNNSCACSTYQRYLSLFWFVFIVVSLWKKEKEQNVVSKKKDDVQLSWTLTRNLWCVSRYF